MANEEVSNCAAGTSFEINHNPGENFSAELPCDKFEPGYPNQQENKTAILRMIGRNDILACRRISFCKNCRPVPHP
jgi:hypothetical protein